MARQVGAQSRKPVPLIVSVNAGPPALAELGLRLEITGGAAPIPNGAGADVPPCATTAMLADPAVAIRFAGTDAVSWVALPAAASVVVFPPLLQRMARQAGAQSRKPVPL